MLLRAHHVALPSLRAIAVLPMSLAKPTERSPLLGQSDYGQNVPANGKPHEGGERGGLSSLPPQDEQPSNARLAVIMGSIWVRYARDDRLKS